MPVIGIPAIFATQVTYDVIAWRWCGALSVKWGGALGIGMGRYFLIYLSVMPFQKSAT